MSEMPIIGTIRDVEAPTIDEVLSEQLVAANPGEWMLEWPEGTKSTWHRAKSRGLDVRLKIYTELGMLCIDRAWGRTCTWRSGFCRRHCYNINLMTLRPTIVKSGKFDEAFWKQLDGEWLYELLHSDRFKTFCEVVGYTPAFMRARMRLATRGEAFAKPEDVKKIKDLLEWNPATTFWIPTRAWIDNKMVGLIEKHVMSQRNARVLASTDPSYSVEEFERVEALGWNTMFFGDNEFTNGMFLCPKTWQRKKSFCRICKPGCYKVGPVDVQLKTHGTRVTNKELDSYGWIKGEGPTR